MSYRLMLDGQMLDLSKLLAGRAVQLTTDGQIDDLADATWEAFRASEEHGGRVVEVVSREGWIEGRVSAPAVYAHTN